jgi:dihydrofolate synthase/folylpolyglutamate synthase
MIAGMLATKDADGFLRNFAGLARRLIAVPVPGSESSLPPEDLAADAREIGLSVTTRDTVRDALEAVRRLDLDPPPRILITGSLYLAGDVLRQNGTPPG